MNKKTTLILIALLCMGVAGFLSGIILCTPPKDSNQDKSYESIQLQSAILYEAFMFTHINSDKLMDNLLVYSGSDRPFLLYDSLQAPTLVICIPPAQETCIACIDNAVESVRAAFDDFSQNRRIVILVHQDDIRFSPRIFRKSIFRYTTDDWLSTIEKKHNNPFFFIVDTDRKMSLFFMPDGSMPDLTTRYLNIAKRKYFF